MDDPRVRAAWSVCVKMGLQISEQDIFAILAAADAVDPLHQNEKMLPCPNCFERIRISWKGQYCPHCLRPLPPLKGGSAA
jgi:hypothetical protein